MFDRRAAAVLSGREEATVVEIYGTTFAGISEIERGNLVRRHASWGVVVDIAQVEDDAIRLWLDDGSTITLGKTGLVEVAR